MKVQPADLTNAATTVDVTTAELIAAQGTSHDAMESALAGWSGASAAALERKLTDWRSGACALHATLHDHRDSLAACARAYENADQANARQLDL